MKRISIAVLLSTLALSFMGGCASTAAYHTAMPRAGWQDYHSQRVSLWLPAKFEGGDPQFMVEKMKAAKNKEGQSGNVVASLDMASKLLEFAAVDKDGVSVAMVMRTNLPIQYKTKKIAELISKGFPSYAQVVSRKVIQLQNYEAGFMLVKHNGKGVMQEIYVIQYNKSLWLLSFITSDSNYKDVKSSFHISAGTLRVDYK